MQSVARAALLGARGNSGVILSQLIRGAAEELVSRPGQLIDQTLIGAALVNAADRAYSSVREPAEGTILTVARVMAHKIVNDVAHSPESPPMGPATEPQAQDAAIASALESAVLAGQDSVKRGPELLAALRDAGVVDAGGYGLTIIFAGVVAALRGDDPPDLDHHAPARISHPQHSSSTHRFCTNFAVTGSGLRPGRFIAPLEALGDSVLVVGDEATLKVHLHTDEPERATAVFATAGEVSRLDVADMHSQLAERDARLLELAARDGAGGDDRAGSEALLVSSAPFAAEGELARCGAVAVVSGDGLIDMYRELGVHTIDGGPTLNPSTYDLLAGIHEVQAEEVVVLTNSANVIMAAERAAELSDKQVLVAPTTSQQAGLAAAVALAPDRTVEQNAQALTEALAHVRTGAVARAARDDTQGRFARGRGRGLRGGGGARLGRARAGAARRAPGARGRRGRIGARRADQRARGAGRAIGARRHRGHAQRIASSSSCAMAARPPTGGCSPPSSNALTTAAAIMMMVDGRDRDRHDGLGGVIRISSVRAAALARSHRSERSAEPR